MDNYGLNEISKNGFYPKLSRTLYIGNLNENINEATLYTYFARFGDIISINIKKRDCVTDRSLKVYAFIKYFDTNNVIHALRNMDGVTIEGCHVRLGFGKSYPSKCVWITGINGSGDNNFLLPYLADCGTIITYSIDHINKRALVYFKEYVESKAAVNKIKNAFKNGLYLHGDYASNECQLKFAEFFNRSAVSRYTVTDHTCIDPKEFTTKISSCIWINGITDAVTKDYLETHFSQFGPILKCLIDQSNKRALLYFQEESHAQSAATAMDGWYIDGNPIKVSLANLMFYARDASNIYIDDVTFWLKGDIAQSSLNRAHHVDSSCTINEETYPINISDQQNNSINVNNAPQYTSQHNYLNTCNINKPKYSSKTIDTNNSSNTIIFNEHPPERLKSPTQYADSDILSIPLPEFAKNNPPERLTPLILYVDSDILSIPLPEFAKNNPPERLKPPTQYADSDILSLPLPEFAKNISKELTSISSRYSLSSNAFANQDTYTFNVQHDKTINYDLGKTDNQNKKQDQNKSHRLKSNYKILEPVKSTESATELQNLSFEEAKRLQDVANKHPPKEFILSQLSPKFKDHQLSSSLSTLSTSGSSDAINTEFANPIPKATDRNKTFLENKIKKVDGNIISSYCSTDNSLKRSTLHVSNPSENYDSSKKRKTDNKTNKNNSTKTAEHNSSLLKPSKNIHNTQKPENKNMSKLVRTPNQPRTRGWMNGFSMFDIISNKRTTRSTNNTKK